MKRIFLLFEFKIVRSCMKERLPPINLKPKQMQAAAKSISWHKEDWLYSAEIIIYGTRLKLFVEIDKIFSINKKWIAKQHLDIGVKTLKLRISI